MESKEAPDSETLPRHAAQDAKRTNPEEGYLACTWRNFSASNLLTRDCFLHIRQEK